MKKITIVLLFAVFVSCTNSPTLDPERATAQANKDQVKSLDSINETLKRIATALEEKNGSSVMLDSLVWSR